MEPPAGEAPERAERLLREAHILRMRRQWAEAEALCRQALELAPDDLMGLEMLGELLDEKGSWDEALKVYRRALALDPGRAALEDRIARLALRRHEDERARQEAQHLLERPRTAAELRRDAVIATLLCLACPGAGQLFKRQHLKGAILLVVGLLALFFGVPDLLKLFVDLLGGRPERGARPPNSFLAFLGLVGVVVWLYALLDAAQPPRRSKDDL